MGIVVCGVLSGRLILNPRKLLVRVAWSGCDMKTRVGKRGK